MSEGRQVGNRSSLGFRRQVHRKWSPRRRSPSRRLLPDTKGLKRRRRWVDWGVMFGALVGGMCAIAGSIVGGGVQGYSWYYFDQKQVAEERRQHWYQMALEWTDRGSTEVFRHADLHGMDLREVNLGPTGGEGGENRGADLSCADLREANLVYAILRRADLRWADLSGADMSLADLSEAWLHGALLQGANLREADLRGAVLYKADLRGADLSRANLTEANLRGADLSGASLNDARLCLADLSEANLNAADLSWANLEDAIITDEQVQQARRLEGAIMRDGTRHD